MQNTILDLGRLAQSQIQNSAFPDAEKTLKKILMLDPNECNALQLYGYVLAHQGKNKECIEVLQRTKKLLPNEYSVLMNLGKALFDNKEYLEAIEIYETVTRIFKKDPSVLMDIGTAYANLKNYELAIKYYQEALEINPLSSDLLNNMSVALYKLEKYDQALKFCKKSVEVLPGQFIAWLNKGNIFFDLGLFEEALSSYKKALSINPHFSEAWTNAGNALLRLERAAESLTSHNMALRLDPSDAEALSSKGATLFSMGQLDEALDAFEGAYKLNDQLCLSMVIYLRMIFCDWKKFYELQNHLVSAINIENPRINPFSTLALDIDSKSQKVCALSFCKKINNLSLSHTFPSRSVNKKIRLGYISSDFGGHPVGQLMLKILELHNKSKFELVGFYLTNPLEDFIFDQIRSTFNQVYDLCGRSKRYAVDVIRSAEIDILIDLNGHTKNSREDILAERLAPIQVSYLGYPGSVGLNSIDYVIADKVVIPDEDKENYLGKVAYIPSFFPASRPSVASDNVMTRYQAGLPENGFIFCCFNATFKITPDVFDIWMRLLKKMPESVLWLTAASDRAKKNLQSEADNRGIDPARIVFANRVDKLEDHLLRLSLADLFLDTFYYNAHTTACDALSVGVPVLTRYGKTFASRIASSMLMSLEISDLICHSAHEYENRAFEIASSPDALAELKKRIRSNLSKAKLFDLKNYVKNLEAFYTIAYDRYICNLPPESVIVSDIKK